MKKQWVVIIGALAGLLYIVFIPLIGTLLILGMLFYKLGKALQMSSKSPPVSQDGTHTAAGNQHPVGRRTGRAGDLKLPGLPTALR